jgi:hypothetical protein
LRLGQREWLAGLAEACPTAAASCLEPLYARRVEALDKAVVQAGPWTFQRVEHTSVAAGQRRHLSTLRIDQPQSPAATAWNKAIQRPVPDIEPDCKGELDRSTSLRHADGRVISVVFDDLTICRDAAHPNDIASAATFVRDGDQARPLRPADLFDPAKDWAALLVKAAQDGLATIAHQGGVDDMTFDADTVRPVATDPANWLVEPKGLTLLFPAETVAPHAFGNQEVTVPWDHLRTLLAPHAVVPR